VEKDTSAVEKDTSAVEQNPTAVEVVLCIEEEEDRNIMGFLRKHMPFETDFQGEK
jgi:CMP-2-keto-3-deoxyoctulosonic acid synthetase